MTRNLELVDTRRIVGPLVALVLLIVAPASAQTCAADANYRKTGDPEYIVRCVFDRAGGKPALKGKPEAVKHFLESLAATLNEASVPAGPFGLLRKTSGSQCVGYSCDIVCSGNGSQQKQWDVLRDAEGADDGPAPRWDLLDTIKVRECEIVEALPPITPPSPPAPPASDVDAALTALTAAVNAINARLDAMVDRLDGIAATSLSAAQFAADIKGIVSVGTGVPADLPLYKGSFLGIGIVSRPCPECQR